MRAVNLTSFTIVFLLAILLQSCSSSRMVISQGVDLQKYKYVVFGTKSTGDRELDDVVMSVQNEIAKTNLEVVSPQKSSDLTLLGESVLTPNIHVTTEKWDGGHTYITVTFYDYESSQSVAVIKSSGIGLTISHDQNIAVKSIQKKLFEVFGER